VRANYIKPALLLGVAALVLSASCGSESPVAPTIQLQQDRGAPPSSALQSLGALSSASDSGEVEFKGRVESVSPPDLKVFGVTVRTTESTRIERNGRRISLGELQVGETVEVEGRLLAGGTVLAEEIDVEDDEVEFRGKVESTSPQLRVGGTLVQTDASTRVTRDDQPITVTDLKVGETVKVEGALLADGSVRAQEIEVVDKSEVEFSGKVESVTPTELMVKGYRVHTDANTRITRRGRGLQLTDIKPGWKVEVEGTLLPDGTVLARKIKVVEDDIKDDEDDEDDSDEDSDDSSDDSN